VGVAAPDAVRCPRREQLSRLVVGRNLCRVAPFERKGGALLLLRQRREHSELQHLLAQQRRHARAAQRLGTVRWETPAFSAIFSLVGGRKPGAIPQW
jgi:hypothetical protein